MNEHQKALSSLNRKVRLFIVLGLIAFIGWIPQEILGEILHAHWMVLMRSSWWLIFLLLMARVFLSCISEIRAWINAAQSVVQERESFNAKVREQNDEFIKLMPKIREQYLSGTERTDETNAPRV